MPMTVQHVKNLTIADVTGTITVFNSAGVTTTMAATDVARPSDWNSAHNVTYTPAASEIAPLFVFTNGLTSSTNTSGVTVGGPYVDYYEPFFLGNTNSVLIAPVVGSWYVDPVQFPFNVDPGLLYFFNAAAASAFQGGAVYSAVTSGSVSKYMTNYFRYGVYTQGTGTNNTLLSRIWSTELQIQMSEAYAVGTSTSSALSITHTAFMSIPAQWDTAGGITYSTSSLSASTSVGASTGASTLANNIVSGMANYLTGSQVLVVPWGGSATAGQYFMAHAYSSSSSTTGTNYGAGTVGPAMSILAMSEFNYQPFKKMGLSTTNISSAPQLFHGYFSTTSNSAPQSMGTDGVRYTSSDHRIYWNYAGAALT